MGFFDRFHKKKIEESAQEEDGGIGPLESVDTPDAGGVDDAPVPAQARTPKQWARLLALNSLVLVCSVGLLASRVYTHLTAPVVIAAKTPTPKPEPKQEKQPEPKAEEPKREEPKKEAPKPKPKPKPKKPLPKPSLASAPVRATPEPQTGSAEIKPIKNSKKRVTRPVSFKHEASSAKQVDLLGMFLVRTQGRKQMFKDSKGIWRSTVYLKTGQTYDFKFEIVDSKGRKRTSATQSVTVP